MKITKRQLRRIILEESAAFTKKYDKDPALKGKQDKLPDALQKAIIDKAADELKEGQSNISSLNKEDYVQWVRDEGHVTSASESVLASYIIALGVDHEYDAVSSFVRDMGMEPEDISREIDRQLDELSMSYGSKDDSHLDVTLAARGYEEVPDHLTKESKLREDAAVKRWARIAGILSD